MDGSIVDPRSRRSETQVDRMAGRRNIAKTNFVFQWTRVVDRAKKKASVPGVETSVSTPGTVFCGEIRFPERRSSSSAAHRCYRPSSPQMRPGPKLHFPVVARMRYDCAIDVWT